MDISLLKTFLLKKFPGILSLHEFHTWTFTPGTLVCTGHITYQAQYHKNSRLQTVTRCLTALNFEQGVQVGIKGWEDNEVES